MRILAFSDLHCDQEAARVIVQESARADVVVGAGDFGIRGERCTEPFDVLKEISIPFLLVSGNHDRGSELALYCSTRENLFHLDGNSQTVSGVTFFGVGGEIPSRSDAAWNETLDEEAAAELLLNAPKYQVLITHTPPYGYCDLQKDGTHEGSEAVANAVNERIPALCLCGHIHHSWGSQMQLKDTTVHNLGPTPSWHVVTEKK